VVRHQRSEVYLDCNATTPVLPHIASRVQQVMADLFGNPSSSHVTGLKARYILDNARQLGRQVLGAERGRLLFTSGATEGIQTAILSALRHFKQESIQQPVLLYGATEHKVVPQALAHWNDVLGLNAQVIAIPVDSAGRLDFDFIRQHRDTAVLICTMAANNETGVMQDLDGLNTLVSELKAGPVAPLWLVDGVQALGKMPLNLAATCIDYAAFSGHKLYAPKGVGCMYVRNGAPFTPLMIGGGQEQGARSGTENLPGIAALAEVFKLLLHPGDLLQDRAQQQHSRAQLATALEAALPGLVFNHDFALSVPTTLNFSVPGVSSRDIMDVFDAANIRVSSGSACSSKVARSFVLDAMGLETWRSEGAIRLSFGPALTAAQLDAACARIAEAGKMLASCCLLPTQANATATATESGLLQWRCDDACAYVLVDAKAKQALSVDMPAALQSKFEHFVRCRGLQVVAQVQLTDAQPGKVQVGGYAVQVLDAGDHCVAAIEVQEHAGEAPQRVQFVIADAQQSDATQHALQLAGFDARHALWCPRHDPLQQLVLPWCEVIGDCQAVADYTLGLSGDRSVLDAKNTLVLDVREPQEHRLCPLPVAAEVRNVPVAQVAQFIADYQASPARQLVCVCRSGTRSAMVAQALIRNGLPQVRHLEGGVALLQADMA